MAVRELDGVDDEIQCAVGTLSGLTYGTYVLLVKRLSVDAGQTIIAPHTSGGTGSGLRAGWTQFNDTQLVDSAGATSNVGGQGTADVWRLLVWRKATGTVTPRVSIYNYATASWQHTNGAPNIGDGTAPGAGGTIRFGIGQFTGRGHYRIAAGAAWANLVKWATDTTGDLTIELAGLEDAYQKWIDATPDAAWRFNQAAVTTAIVDDTGNGADETALVGTTVVTTDDPAGFDFTLSGGSTNVSGSDTGTLTEAASITVQVSASDTLTAAESMALSGSLTVEDVLTLADTGSVLALEETTRGEMTAGSASAATMTAGSTSAATMTGA